MTKNRILLIHGDRLLQRFFQDKLEQSGFEVDMRNDLEAAEAILSQGKPDVILLDPVHHWGRAVNFIKLLRADPSTENIPVLILPTALTELANAALQAGATKFIRPGVSLIASVIDAVKASLGQPGLGEVSNVGFFQTDDMWVKLILADALPVIDRMRKRVPAMMATPPEPAALRGLWFLVHGFAERARLLPTKPLSQFLDALDVLMHDMNESSDQLNPSTLRTIGQALDFLTTLADPDSLARLAEPSKAKILVVDDEPSALQFIAAALRLANLKAKTADTPTAAIEQFHQGHWDLIFLDIGLPEVDGFQLCTKIRAIEKLKATPIIFITGMVTLKNRATTCVSGGNDFVGKPFNLANSA